MLCGINYLTEEGLDMRTRDKILNLVGYLVVPVIFGFLCFLVFLRCI